jgi:hypothetical protein
MEFYKITNNLDLEGFSTAHRCQLNVERAVRNRVYTGKTHTMANATLRYRQAQ